VQTHDGGDKPVQRWYSIDIDAALDPAVDRDETIIAAPELSGQESELAGQWRGGHDLEAR